ncbi:SUVZ09G0795 [Saccharomyces uvarum]|uniref:SUVZ09G0795 protein n=1 Tax=Saccharomyces uvarum TaxID=230603 RepID=A0ABN8WZ84_SACUV|nr:SUVZ09G0795 [Saccharomyces uvarum]
MEKAREIEPNVAIDKDKILKSKFFLFVEKLSSATNIVFSAVFFMTPSLCHLKEEYPKFVDVSDTISTTLTFICISLQVTHEFLLFKNDLLEDQFKREPKKCSRSVCSRCAARGQHPKWFKLKYSLVLLATFFFGVYSLLKINTFFKADQTVDFSRLLHLFGFQLNALLSMMVFVFYANQLELHSGPLETDDDINESQALVGLKMV